MGFPLINWGTAKMIFEWSSDGGIKVVHSGFCEESIKKIPRSDKNK